AGGAARTERPFKRGPGLATSTGAYLLGLMPPELLTKLRLQLPLVRRDPHYFLPTAGKKYLLFGSDAAAMKEQFRAFFSEQDWRANEELQREIAQLREDVAPTWLEEPLSIEETAQRYVRPALQRVFVDLCRKPVGHYLDRFEFRSDLLKAMYAVTDGFSGLNGDWDTPGTGMNFLVHNMCRLPGSDGTWMIVKGGMGAVTARLAATAVEAGATIETGRSVQAITPAPLAVHLRGGGEVRARAVVVNADPFRLRDLIGRHNLPGEWNARVDGYRRDGTTFKVNLALSDLPRFTCLPEDRGQFGSTMHLGARGGHLPAHSAEDRAPLRHHPRPHPPRGQFVRLRRPPPVRHADRGRVFLQRGVPSRRLGDRGGRPQRGRARGSGPRGVAATVRYASDASFRNASRDARPLRALG